MSCTAVRSVLDTRTRSPYAQEFSQQYMNLTWRTPGWAVRVPTCRTARRCPSAAPTPRVRPTSPSRRRPVWWRRMAVRWRAPIVRPRRRARHAGRRRTVRPVHILLLLHAVVGHLVVVLATRSDIVYRRSVRTRMAGRYQHATVRRGPVRPSVRPTRPGLHRVHAVRRVRPVGPRRAGPRVPLWQGLSPGGCGTTWRREGQ